jgi:hypothetical protein
MEIEYRVALAPNERLELERALSDQRTLDEVVRWALADDPPRLVAGVIVQDEYTHDVVLPYRAASRESENSGEVFLVYDTT